MEKMTHNPLPVYLITRTGVGYNDEGIRHITDWILNEDTSEAGPQGYGIDDTTTGALVASGKHLLDPEILANSLEESPTARVVLSIDGGMSMTLCPYGPDDEGLPLVIRALHDAKAEGIDSYRVLLRKVYPEKEAELYGGG